MKNKGPLYVLTCYVIWGLLPIFWKLLAQVDSLYVLASRIVWSMVLTGGILLLRRDRLAGVRAAFRDRREWGLLAAAGCVVCVNWGVYIWAVANGHMIDSSLAYYMNPILAILLGTVLFRERLTKLQWLAVAVTFAGLVITVIRYRQIPWIALVIGGSFAVYGALKKQVRSDAAVSTFVETLTLAPFALVLIFWMEAHGTGAAGVLSGWQWLLLPVSGVVTTVPLMFFAAGMKTTPMTLSGILMYINPTMQLLLSVALYGEAFTATHAILFGFVWTGLILYLISGGRRLKELEGTETRPTTDRVKEGLFSALQFDIEGRRVLDLFAGTGQLGIECLSRGAASAVFVDRRADAVKLIRENLKLTELQDRARVVAGDSMEFLRSLRERFDIVFLDPPYEAGLLEPAVAHLTAFDILNPHGIIVAEHPADRSLPAPAAPYRVRRTYRYGRIALTLIRRGGDRENEE